MFARAVSSACPATVGSRRSLSYLSHAQPLTVSTQCPVNACGWLTIHSTRSQRQPNWAPAQGLLGLRQLRITAEAEDIIRGMEEAAKKPPISFNVRPITKGDVEVSFSRSSGAGGQNVNKVSTKVDMRWELNKAGWVPDEVKEQIRIMEKNRITNDGVLVVQSQRHRTQPANLEDALLKLQTIIDAAVDAATPTIADEATIKRVKAQLKAGKEKRLDSKKKDSNRKKERSRRDFD